MLLLLLFELLMNCARGSGTCLIVILFISIFQSTAEMFASALF